MANIGFRGKNIIDIIKYRFVWLAFSALLVIPCLGFMIYSMFTLPTHSPVMLGIDFTGGTFLQYGFQEKFEVKDIARIRSVLDEIGQGNAVIQIQEPADILGSLGSKKEKAQAEDGNLSVKDEAITEVNETAVNEAVTNSKAVPEAAEKVNTKTEPVKTAPVESKNEKANLDKAVETKLDDVKSETKAEDSKVKTDVAAEEAVIDENGEATTTALADDQIKTIVSMRVKFLNDKEIRKLNTSFRSKFGNFSIIQVSAIGPSLGKELLRNAMFALLFVFGGIVLYLAVRFQIDYAICALIALFHDAIIVMGIFSAFGIFFHTEVDSLFVTAILTVIGFSVHDTIVVFDRIRENARFLSKKKTFNEICNDSVNQTLARSINTSVTTLFVLLCLYFFGGITTKDFVLAMTLGIAIGTYSSIFNASVNLAFWREINAPKRRRKASA